VGIVQAQAGVGAARPDLHSMAVKRQLAPLGVTQLPNTDVFPLSSAQQRLWLAGQPPSGMPAHHRARVIDLDGQLDVKALTAALSEIAARHEALRTSVTVVAGQPVQRVAGPAAVELPVIETTDAAAAELAMAAARRPLDLAGGPLWRAELHRLSPGRHRLVLVFHHIIADAATVAMLLAELAAAYRAFHAGAAPELPPAVPYRAYVSWERSFGTDPDSTRQLDYWRSQLAGCEPAGLPAEPPRPVTARRPAARVPVRIPAMDAYLLRDLARTNGATLNQLVLAGYAVVLHRCGGRASFAIGMPVSTRHDRRWTHSAGPYVATLPIRVSMTGNPVFTELLRQVRGTVLAALGACDVPLERVTGPAGPLYDVTFGMAEGGGPEFALPELTCRMDRVQADWAEFGLHLEITDPGPGGDLEGLLEYDAELFSPPAAGHLADGLATLLHGVAATPDRPIGHLPLWPDVPAPSAAVAAAGPGAGQLSGRRR
jgi:Condensation domain